MIREQKNLTMLMLELIEILTILFTFTPGKYIILMRINSWPWSVVTFLLLSKFSNSTKMGIKCYSCTEYLGTVVKQSCTCSCWNLNVNWTSKTRKLIVLVFIFLRVKQMVAVWGSLHQERLSIKETFLIAVSSVRSQILII